MSKYKGKQHKVEVIKGGKPILYFLKILILALKL